jgi:uncharacterized protein YbbC (DUF1343 family)
MLCGLDQLYAGKFSGLRRRLRSTRVAVLTHAAAVDGRGRQSLTVLEELGVRPELLFSPEHGLNGYAQAEEAVPSAGPESRFGSRGVVSLYGSDRRSLSPSSDVLSTIDLLVVDLCDVGARYYTYAWTALLSVRAAQACGVHSVILDRPNPISGDPATLEGKPQQPGFLSFVGLEPVPIRHALTLAELLAHFADRDGHPLGPDGALSVVPTRGWERHRTAAAWDRPFVMPSPNMPTVETALAYPGGCLLEGTNLSEGRGTTTPFQIVGAPFLDGEALATALRDAGTPGAIVRPVAFRPSFDKHAGQRCSGVMIHVTNPRLFRPVAAYLRLVTLAQRQEPEQFAFRTAPYEFEAAVPAFDLLTGSAEAREAIIHGASPEEVVELVAPPGAQWSALVSEAEARLQDALAS